jgi:hypothetical protein
VGADPATMSSEGGFAERRQVVADVATMLFGTALRRANVIGETLERATGEAPPRVPPERIVAEVPRA